MSTRFLSRIQIDKNLRRSTENVEIVPQETCVHHESTESMVTEYASTTIVKKPNISSSSSTSEIGSRRNSETAANRKTTIPNSKNIGGKKKI